MIKLDVNGHRFAKLSQEIKLSKKDPSSKSLIGYLSFLYYSKLPSLRQEGCTWKEMLQVESLQLNYKELSTFGV